VGKNGEETKENATKSQINAKKKTEERAREIQDLLCFMWGQEDQEKKKVRESPAILSVT